ncbi:MAG: two-component system sensor kinase [Herminiimonas sp.]|nr:two-component system sensor kinase [Herminiimonas sp.]
MLANNKEKKSEIAPSFAADVTDAPMVGWMRLAVSFSVLLTIFIDPSGLSGVKEFTWLLFSGYFFHSAILCIFSQKNQPFAQSKLIHWLDVCWYALIVFFTGGNNSFFFFFFFFAIFTSSFRWGFEEGARVTLVSAILFMACGLVSDTEHNLPRLLLRITFLLAFGYMSAYWGETKVRLKHRLALLRDVSRLSNPRFGVDHTMTSVLEKTKEFFKGSGCILVMRDKESGTYSLRMIKKCNAKQSITAECISEETASPLMAFSPDHIVAYTRSRWLALPLLEVSVAYDNARTGWIKHDGQRSAHLAELLETHSFITAPLSLRKAEGRIYVVSEEIGFSKGDALFLSHIAAQAFPVIENIELLDRMASEAARQERQKIALNLHDTAIQPYIGLKLGLMAMRKNACADNPLIEDIDKLTAMTAQVIDDLRRYAGTFKNGWEKTEPIFLVALRRQAAQVREFYGIDIAVSMEGVLNVSDRLTAEVLHVVREGLSNICKHTVAQRGCIKLQCANGWLKIQIENEGADMQPIPFIPRSIAERAAALGGRAQVKLGTSGRTVVHVEIPV